MDQTQQLSIVIPLRIESHERLSNLQTVVGFLLQHTESTILLLEADIESHISNLFNSDRVSIFFRKDLDPIFHRTKYINELLNLTQTPFVGVWDTDVIPTLHGIRQALNTLQQGYAMCLPYDGKFIFLSAQDSNLLREGMNIAVNELHDGIHLGRPSVGGAYMVNKDLYLGVGGENETFYGWGPEDIERVKRMEILGYEVKRAEGPLYHLHHPRGINSTLGEDERAVQNLDEFTKICSMFPYELNHYITRNLVNPQRINKKKLIVVGNKDISCSIVDTFDYVIRINRMTNYGNTGYRTDGLYLEANNVFKNIYTGEMLKKLIDEETHIFMNPKWYRQFYEWRSYLTPRQYMLAELIDYDSICSDIGVHNPTSGVSLLVHLLNSSWRQEYDIYIVGFELEDRLGMIDNNVYWAWHYGAGEAELTYLNKCIESGILKVLESTPTT